LNVLLALSFRFVVDGGRTLNKNEVLEINTTAPSVNCSASCNYNASHENRSSGVSVSHLVAVITFTDDIVFNSSSTVKVVGDYALSIKSLHGNIEIQTDINMTCGETRLNTTCLGGFTRSPAGEQVGLKGKKTLYQGKGSIVISCFLFELYLVCM